MSIEKCLTHDNYDWVYLQRESTGRRPEAFEFGPFFLSN